MRKANELEIEGIGKVYTYFVNIPGKEFELETADGKPVKQVRGASTPREAAVYTDGTNTYSKDQLFYKIGGKQIPASTKIKKTERIKTYSVEDASRWWDFTADSRYIVVPADEATHKRLHELGAYGTKAIVPAHGVKKTDTGTKFHGAVFYQVNGVLYYHTSEKPAHLADISEQVKTELLEKEALKAALAEGKTEMVVKAEEIEVIL